MGSKREAACMVGVLYGFALDAILMQIEFILMMKFMCTSLGLLCCLECSGCSFEVEESRGFRADSGVKLGGIEGPHLS